MMARFNSAKADYGQSYLLLTILAAVLGGTSASGGYGKVIGVVLAVIMLQMLASGLNVLGVDPFFAIAMWGAILLTVETLNHFAAFPIFARTTQSRSAHLSTPLNEVCS